MPDRFYRLIRCPLVTPYPIPRQKVNTSAMRTGRDRIPIWRYSSSLGVCLPFSLLVMTCAQHLPQYLRVRSDFPNYAHAYRHRVI
jgi:hypothetical protein